MFYSYKPYNPMSSKENPYWYYTWPYCPYCHIYQQYYCQRLNSHKNQMNLFYRSKYNYLYRQPEQREFTVTELQNYDGSNGKPAYVAVNGIVYDVSNEATWGGGTHFGLYAGKDLTNQFQGCHGLESILGKLPKIGILKAE